MTSIDSWPFSAADVSFAFSMKKSNKKDHIFGVEHDILVVCICFLGDFIVPQSETKLVSI